MAHPNKKEGVSGHNAKLKRLTQDYGAADKAAFKVAKGTLENGPQKDTGFGSKPDEAASSARGDKARRTSAANPIATYKKGGRVRAAGGEVQTDWKPSSGGASGGGGSSWDKIQKGPRLSPKPAPKFAKGGRVRHSGGGVIGGGVAMRADGGRLEGPMGMPSGIGGGSGGGGSSGRKRSGGTNVNIIVAPQGGGQQPPAPVIPPVLPPPPPGGAGGPPPGMGAPGGAPGGMPLPPGAMPPGALPPGLPMPGRKRGGRIPSINMDAGAMSGEGRLEKAEARSRRKSGDKSAEV